MITGIYYRK